MDQNLPLDAVILQETFHSYPVTNVSYNLVLTDKFLLIDGTSKGKTSEKIVLTDIIGCHVFGGKNSKSGIDSKDNSAYFCIYAYPLKICSGILSKQIRRDRRTLTFQFCKFETETENLHVVTKWYRAINCALKGVICFLNGDIKIPEIVPLPKKFLILVNPRSGAGKAYQIFKDRVIPLLIESDTQYELLVTDRANCARDYMKKADLSQWNGIVVVSGDGLLFEVYNGIMSRSDWKETVKIPVGVIPGGSGNGLARAINYAAGEPYDVTVVTPSVLNIIKGRVIPMDLVRVQTPNETFYSFLSIGWGLMADIDIESERLRYIGEARFTVWALVKMIGFRKYKGRLSYLPVSGYQPNGAFSKTQLEPKPKRSKTIDCQLSWSQEPTNLFRSKSFGTQDADDDVQLLKYSYSIEKFHPVENDVLPKPLKESTTNIPHDHCKEEQALDDDEIEDEETQQTEGVRYCPPLHTPVPPDWVVSDSEFVLVYACHQTHISTDVMFAPHAKLDDGIMWLVVMKAGVSRGQVLHFLSHMQTGEHVHVPYVDVIPVHAFRLEPSRSDSYLTVDGEVIPCCPIQAEVMPSAARVMCR